MKKYLAIAVLSFIFLVPGTARAAITSVTLTPASPTTLTNGRSYYLAGVPYEFRVQATDPAATGKTYWDRIVVDIRQGAVTQESFTINIGPDNAPSVTGVIVDSIVDQSGATYTNIDYRITVRFLWTCAFFTAGTNSVRATVYTDTAGNDVETKSLYFGVISAIRVLNFAQSGDASDGKITPWHANFNVTGRIVYYDAAAPTQIIANQVPVSEITAVALFRAKTAPVPAGPVDTTLPNTGTDNDVIFTIDQTFLGPGGRPGNLGVYRWDIRATMATGGVTEISGNTLDVRMDEVRIDSLLFEAGGGVDPTVPAPYYVRSVNVTGTRIRLRASMRSGVLPAGMAGNTSFTITTGANTYTLLVPNLAIERTVLIDPVPAVAPGANVEVNYTVSAISGGSYDGGQSLPARIVDAAGTDSRAYPCRWENHHPPGNNAAPFTGDGGFSSTATSFTVNWTPLSEAGPTYDHDFYTYRIYFKRSSDAVWTMVDRTVAGFASLGTIGTGICTVGSAANPLQVLTAYDYQISAEDVWGNEVILANRIQNSLTTTAFQVTASISDGISVYNNEHFNNPDPLARPVRDAGIKITLRITTSGGAPDKVSIIFAANDSDMAGAQHGVTGAFDNFLDVAFPADQLWTVPCLKVTANTYEGIISSENPLMQYGTNIRFIVATEKSGNTTYTDHTPDPPGPGDSWSDEWRFRVEKKAIFIPWPTRVLNNVMNAAMPCCYPAYFVPVASLVTIKVYDVKGRVIATLSDRVYRPGGQNIKDQGWCGYNKDNKRVGPGLYYIEIKAVTIGNKTVIDKMLKVVVAH